MLYTVGEAAKLLNVAPSTLRYYDKEGLLPFVERSDGGMRVFADKDFGWLRLVECLKKSGLSIKDIKSYLDMTVKGDETIEDRLMLLRRQKEKVERQMEELRQTLNILNYKCWYYETAKEAGTTEVPQNMTDDEMPPEFAEIRRRMRK